MLRHPLIRALGMLTGYITFMKAVQLLFISFIAYALVRSTGEGTSSVQRMSDVIRANRSITYGLSAFAFMALLHVMHPLTQTRLHQVFDFSRIRTHFVANALNGLILTLVLVIGTVLGGYMSYLGIYMRFDEVVLSVFSSAILGTSLFLLVLVEEYLMRQVLEPNLEEYVGTPVVLAISSLVFLIFKVIQFDVSWLMAVNLILWNLTLSTIARAERSFAASASFGATFLILTHVVFGLPYMGQDVQGLLLVRAATSTRTGGWLSGGAMGPEGGLVLTLLLVLYLLLPQLRTRKIRS